MNTENQLNYYSYALKNHLMNNEVFLKKDLEQLLQGKAIDFIDGKNFTDVAVSYLEYSADRLNIIFSCEDNEGNGLSQPTFGKAVFLKEGVATIEDLKNYLNTK